MKDLSMSGNTSIAGSNENDGSAEEKKFYPKMFETIEPFFVRRIPVWKRTLDIFGSFFGLIIFVHIMPETVIHIVT